MIREAEQSDIPRLIEMGRRFRSESSYKGLLVDCPLEHMNDLLLKLIPQGGVLVEESDTNLFGMIGFYVYPHFLSGELTAGEVFWWVEPEHRGNGLRLLRETENRARTAGAKRLQMIAPNERVGALYKRLGYEFVESTYQRSL